MKILILGGTGILSTDFTTLCLDKENDVYIVNRGRRKSFIAKGAKLIVADLREEDINSLRIKLNIESWDVIIDFLTFNVDHMKKSIEIFQGNFEQYIFISSATVYKKNYDREIITEESEIGNNSWDYAYNKYLCEKYLETQQFNYTIIRPYVTFGKNRIPFPIIPDGYHYTLIQRIKNHKPVIMLDGGEAICTLTTTKDFANILYKILANKSSYGKAYHITSDSRQSWKEVYEMLCSILKCEPNYLSVTIDEIHKYLPEFESILRGDKGQCMMFDNSKIKELIGEYRFECSLEKALKDSIEFFENNEEMQGIDYKWDGKCDYIANKKGYKKLSCIPSNSNRSNQKIWYFLMTNPITWNCYHLCRKLKGLIINNKKSTK